MQETVSANVSHMLIRSLWLPQVQIPIDPLTLALRPSAAAKASGISLGMLYRLWREGDGPPYIRVGADRRVLIDDLRDWLASRRVAA